MRVAIDARELSKGQPGGFNTYLRGLLWGLADVDQDNDYILYIDRPVEARAHRLPARTQMRLLTANRILADQLTLPRAIAADSPDVVHFPCNYGVRAGNTPAVITLHDSIFMERKAAMISFKGNALAHYTRWMASRSVGAVRAVITVSDYSRSRILRFFDIGERLKVVHNGGPLPLQDEASAEQDELPDGLPRAPFLLLLASVDPRKNTELAIKAFPQTAAHAEGCRMVVVCSHPSAAAVVRQWLAESGLESSASVVTGVSDTQLRGLYRMALGFVFASLEEGFGLPPLEAMACGCPVISSRCSAMPEILGDAALYFQPTDGCELATKMDMLWHGDELRMHLRDAGVRCVEQYSWSKTAERTAEVYRDVAERHTLNNGDG